MYTLSESKIIQLTEKGGVAAYPYRDAIDEMFDYCNEYIKNNNEGNYKKVNIRGEIVNLKHYSFVIPFEITNKIEWFNNLIVQIWVTDILNEELNPDIPVVGSGSYNMLFKQTFNNGKMQNPNIGNDPNNTKQQLRIDLSIVAHKANLIPLSFYQSVYHETNHGGDDFSRQSKGEWSKRENETEEEKRKREGEKKKRHSLLQNIVTNGKYNYDTIESLRDSSNNIERAFGWLVYRLLIPTEFNAFVAGMYGELKAIKEKGNYRTVLYQTQAFKDYQKMKDVYLKTLINTPVEQWVSLMPYYNIGNTDPGAYKNKFIQLIDKQLKELFERWGKVGSLYNEEYRDQTRSLVLDEGLNREFWDFFKRIGGKETI